MLQKITKRQLNIFLNSSTIIYFEYLKLDLKICLCLLRRLGGRKGNSIKIQDKTAKITTKIVVQTNIKNGEYIMNSPKETNT